MTVRNDATRIRIETEDERRPRAVVARQGQVLLDTDVDQQSRHHLERLEVETVDTLGSPGRFLVPEGNTGFQVTGGTPASDFEIGAGRGYLEGWLLENPSACTLETQPHPWSGDAAAPPAIVAVKALVRYVDPVEEPVLADVALGDAQASGRSLVDWQVFPLALPEGDEATCAASTSNETWLKLTAPSTGTLTVFEQEAPLSTDPCSLTPEGGYSRLENLLYRIEVHGGDPDPGFPAADGPRFRLDQLEIKLSRRNASLLARITAVDGTSITVSPPALDPRAWFAPGLHAEIVSIHDDVDPSAALAAERLFRIANASDETVLLEGDAADLAATGVASDGSWFLRLWDAFPDGAGIAVVDAPGNAAESEEIDLGDGLKVKLGAGASSTTFRRGDHWTFAARADGSIDWPMTGAVPDAMTPHGPEVRYAPLAALAVSGEKQDFEDCRIPFATLSDRALFYRGGDGQEVFGAPSSGMVSLPAKLRVGVMRGETPVAGATVRWSYVGPAGGSCLLDGATCDAGNSPENVTDADGLAEMAWSIDSGKHLDVHQVQAALVVDETTTRRPPVVFTAAFRTAEGTSYTPGKCEHLAGVDNVQDALDALCEKVGEDPDSLILSSILLFGGSGQSQLVSDGLILNGATFRHDVFEKAIVFSFSGAKLAMKVQTQDPVVEVELDLPYPTTDPDRWYWVQAASKDGNSASFSGPFGFQRVRLDGKIKLVDKGPDNQSALVWEPSAQAVKFLNSATQHQWGQKLTTEFSQKLKARNWGPDPTFREVLCRIRLRSALIWADGKDGRVYLNAEHLGVTGPATGREIAQRDRDPQRAADLDLFVYLSAEG